MLQASCLTNFVHNIVADRVTWFINQHNSVQIIIKLKYNSIHNDFSRVRTEQSSVPDNAAFGNAAFQKLGYTRVSTPSYMFANRPRRKRLLNARRPHFMKSLRISRKHPTKTPFVCACSLHGFSDQRESHLFLRNPIQ